ncbi:MAG: glycosyltransferase [Candidatus Solibacter usitatus]|nr:glycosyltransferase [Candidatus Solibacter usitatus]
MRRCLDAVEKSTPREALQVIVLDPGMHDTSTQWDIDHPDVEFLRMPRNFGATKALSIGIRSAKAELLFFLDPAVEIKKDTIAKLVEALERNPESGAVCPLLVDGAGVAVPQIRQLPSRGDLSRLWQDENALTAATPQAVGAPIPVEYPGRKALLIPLPFLKGMNYFDARYGEWGGDLELAFQIHHASKKAYIVPDVTTLDHSASEPQPSFDSGQRATLTADRLNGVAHYIGKRSGFFAGIWMRIQAVLITLVRALTFQDAGYNWSLLFDLLNGKKIDGSQANL